MLGSSQRPEPLVERMAGITFSPKRPSVLRQFLLTQRSSGGTKT